jgi:hypothetical protein
MTHTLLLLLLSTITTAVTTALQVNALVRNEPHLLTQGLSFLLDKNAALLDLDNKRRYCAYCIAALTTPPHTSYPSYNWPKLTVQRAPGAALAAVLKEVDRLRSVFGVNGTASWPRGSSFSFVFKGEDGAGPGEHKHKHCVFCNLTVHTSHCGTLVKRALKALSLHTLTCLVVEVRSVWFSLAVVVG